MWARRAAWGWLALVAAAGLLGWGLVGPEAAMRLDRTCLNGCAPGVAHPLGTDALGRDVGLQLAVGAATALGGGLAAAGLSLLVGLLLGGAAAYLERARPRGLSARTGLAAAALLVWLAAGAYFGQAPTWWLLHGGLGIALVAGVSRLPVRGLRLSPTRVLLAIAELFASVPALLLLLALAAAAWRPGLWQLVLLYAAVRWTGFAVLAMQELRAGLGEAYAAAAARAGAPLWRVLARHVLPNAIPPLLVATVLSVSGFVVVEGTFAFLGLGLPPELPSWGRLLGQARQLSSAWWLWLWPGTALTLTVLALQTVARGWRRSAGARPAARLP